MPTKFCCWDIETRGSSSEFSSGAWRSDQERDWSTDPQVVLEALRRHAQRRYTLAAHNAEYDLTTFLWKQGEDVSLHYYEGTFVHAAWRYNGSSRTAPVWDSMRLSAGLSVKDLGEAIGLPKFEMPQKLGGVDPDRYRWQCQEHQIWECERCYTLRDVDIIFEHLTRLQAYVEPFGVELRRTLPATAVKLWLKLDPGQQQSPHSKQVRQLAREAQHGGRCEVFRYGAVQQVHVYDVRRHYGYLLASEPMPDLQTLSLERDMPADWPLDGKEGVVEATVFQEPLWCPTLPVVADKALCYPVGVFRDTWAIVELRRAIARGARVLKFHQALSSTRTVLPFLNVAQALLVASCDWEDQQNPLYLVPKQLLNSLTGRLGMQEGGESRIYRRWVPGMNRSDLFGWELSLGSDAVHLYQSRAMEHPPETANILWAVQVLALGRVKLLSHLEQAGLSLLYCDTDSAHSAVPLPVEGNKPGQLQDKGEFSQGRYLAPKLYRLEDHVGNVLVRAKGVPRRLAEEFFGTGQVSFQSALGVQDALARGKAPGSWVDVDRVRHLGLSRRVLDNPRALTELDQSSGTQPLTFGGD